MKSEMNTDKRGSGGGWNRGKGKGWTDKRGYRQVNVQRDGVWGPMREHRFVMERHLRRKLNPWELVHHLNGIKTDNRIENLKIEHWLEHTREHHKDARREASICRQIEAFALMRGELGRKRKLIASLVEALRKMTAKFERGGEAWMSDPDWLEARAALKLAGGGE